MSQQPKRGSWVQVEPKIVETVRTPTGIVAVEHTIMRNEVTKQTHVLRVVTDGKGKILPGQWLRGQFFAQKDTKNTKTIQKNINFMHYILFFLQQFIVQYTEPITPNYNFWHISIRNILIKCVILVVTVTVYT